MAAPTIVTSILTGGVNNHQTTSEEANGVYTDFVSEGVVGTVGNTSGVAPATGGFAVNAAGTPDTTVVISTGVAYVNATPSSQNNQTFRVKCSTSGTATISANASGSTKYDWVYIKLDATKLNGPNTAGDDVATIVTSRSSSSSSDDGSPPTYGYPLAVVTVANGFSTITNSNIRDIRSQVALNTGTSNANDGWTALSTTTLTTTSGYNTGNRIFSITSSADMTAVLSPGMRLKVTRGVTPPTQCTSLNGTTQYWSKSSPASTTFTDDFTVSAWIKVTSYAAGSIISRYNGTSGWDFRLEATGQITLAGYNAGSSNTSYVLSYASVPLNKWIHVAAQLDMSTFTATTTTSYIMLNGLDIPSSVGRSGTNPTALVQAGNLEVGSRNAGTQFFPGKIAQVALYSAKVTQATIQDRMCQELTGSETNIISYFKFDGNGNDTAAAANNLSAQASATATTVDNPFNATEYAIVRAVSASTITVIANPGYTIPNVTLSTPYYSTRKQPFGFPPASNIISEILMATNFTSTTVAGVDIPPFTTTFTPIVGREIRLRFAGNSIFKTGSAGDSVSLYFADGSSIIHFLTVNMTGSNYAFNPTTYTPAIVPTTGSHTYKMQIGANAAGTMQVSGATNAIATFTVEYVSDL